MNVTGKKECSVFLVKPCNVFIEYSMTQSLERASGCFRIINNSTQPQRVTIVPPKTEYFCIDYCNPGWLYSGAQFSVSVLLKTELTNRAYYDCIKIKCSLGCQTEVPIEAFPWNPYLIHIPKKINFGPIFLGEIASKKFVLEITDEPQPFLFVIPSENQDLKVTPSQGEVNSEPVQISVTYSPSSYTTVNIPVLLYMPNILVSPYYFCVTAFTKPGEHRDKIISEKRLEKTKEVQPKCFKQVERKTFFTVPTIAPDDGVPLWSHHKTNNYLIKKEKSLKSPDELLGPLGKYLDDEQLVKRAKEDAFLYYAKEIRKENISAYSHQREKLRDSERVIYDTNQVWKEYKDQIRSPPWDSIYESALIRQRPIQKFNQHVDLNFTDVYPNLWFVRYQIMCKFIEAGRKIMIYNRMVRRLMILKNLTKEDIENFQIIPLIL